MPGMENTVIGHLQEIRSTLQSAVRASENLENKIIGPRPLRPFHCEKFSGVRRFPALRSELAQSATFEDACQPSRTRRRFWPGCAGWSTTSDSLRMTSTAAKPALEKSVLVVTKAELEELRDAEKAHADAAKKAALAEATVKSLRFTLAEKVLGIESSDELKAMSPEKVQKLYAKRQAAGVWVLGKGAPVFAFALSSKGRFPAWKALFISEQGESAANQAMLETDYTHSYKVEVAVPA